MGSFQIVLYETGDIKFNYDYLSHVPSPTIGINYGPDTRFYSRYLGMSAPLDNYSVLFTHDTYSHDPVLSAGQVTPAAGDQNTPFNFTVLYNDADNVSAKLVRVFINGTAFNMVKSNPADDDYTDGCLYQYCTQLQPGDYDYYFDCSDGVASSQTAPAPLLTVSQTNVHAPVLSAPWGIPAWGLNGTTVYDFHVTYSDQDNNAPVSINLAIAGMVIPLNPDNPSDSNYTDGNLYRVSTMLPPGTHPYVFNVTDGGTTVNSGPHGPVVTELLMDWDQVSLAGFHVIAITFHDEANPITKYPGVVSHLASRGATFEVSDAYVTLDVLLRCDAIWIDEGGVGLQPDELATIVAWCNGGGRVILTGDDLSAGMSVANAFNVSYVTFGTTDGYLLNFNMENHTIVAGISSLYSNRASFSIDVGSCPGLRPVTGWPGRCLAATLEPGAGKMLFLADDTFLLQPSYVDNQLFVRNAFGWIGYEENARAPQLDSPGASATAGTESTCFNFTVTYRDQDNTRPHAVSVSINGTSRPMIKANIDDYTFTDGCLFYLPVFLAPGQHNYSFIANDGKFTNSTGVLGWIDVGHVNTHVPQVINVAVDPFVEGMACMLNFSATYVDADNNQPVTVTITINGTTYPMTKAFPFDENAMDGMEYYLEIALAFGDHVYQVNVTDGGFANASAPAILAGLTPYTFGSRYDIVINEATWDGSHKFELYNYGPDRVMTGWTLMYADYQFTYTYTFPAGFLFRHGHIVVIEEKYLPDAGDCLFFRHTGLNTYDIRAVALFNASGSSMDWMVCFGFTIGTVPADARWSGAIPYVANAYYIGRSSDTDTDMHTDFQRAATGSIGTLNPGQTGARGAYGARPVAPPAGMIVEAGLVSFNWTSIELVASSMNYTVEVAADAGFTSILYTFSTIPETPLYTLATQPINLTTGTYYWRVSHAVDGFGGGTSAPSTLLVHRAMFDPALHNATVTPLNGNQYTTFTFSAVYAEIDNNAPSSILLWLNGTSYAMVKQNASDTNYRDGCTYVRAMTLPLGNYSFFVNCTYAAFSNQTPVVTAPGVAFFNAYQPTLDMIWCTPGEGITNTTTFQFRARYHDLDNDAPAYINVTYNSETHAMAKILPSDITYTDGCEYFYETILPTGMFTFRIEASDGEHAIISSIYNGPMVANPKNYTMLIGVPFEWIEASSGYTIPIGKSDVWSFGLPFPVSFYGFPYDTSDSFWITTNGYGGFGASSAPLDENADLPQPFMVDRMVAPFWDDIRTTYSGASGHIYYLSTPSYLVFQWSNVMHGDGNLIGSFQLVVYPNGDIRFNYDYINYTAGNYTCGLNLGIDTRFYTQYNGMIAPVDDFSILFTYGGLYATQPPDELLLQGTPGENITWQLHTDEAPGQYRITRNGTTVQPWTAWPDIDVNITITIDTSTIGDWVYIMEYNDSTGATGVPSSVLVSINDVPSINGFLSWDGSVFLANASGQGISCWILDTYGGTGAVAASMNGSAVGTIAWNNGITITLPVATDRGLGQFNYSIHVTDVTGIGTSNAWVWIIIAEGPSCTHPADQVVLQGGTGHAITWLITDKAGPGSYRVLRNSAVIVAWTAWQNDTDIQVPIATGVGVGSFTYRLEYNNSAGTNGIPDTVVVIVNDIPVVAKAPAPVSIEQNSTGTVLTWILTDTLGGGTYSMYVNGTPLQGFTSRPWSSNAPLMIPVNANGGTGDYNFTLVFFDAHGTRGVQSVVIVTITPVTKNPVLAFLEENWLLLAIAGASLAVAIALGATARRKKRVTTSGRSKEPTKKSTAAGTYSPDGMLSRQQVQGTITSRNVPGAGATGVQGAVTTGRFQCPTCGTMHDIPDPVFDAWYSCPRCASELVHLQQCPSCNQFLSISREYHAAWRGKETTCPTCGGKVLVH